MDPIDTPGTTAYNAAHPQVIGFDPEAQRRKVAMALQLQRGMNKHPLSQFANTALQAWNMSRKMPGPTQPAAPPPDRYEGYGD